jgi:hypothetical protein
MGQEGCARVVPDSGTDDAKAFVDDIIGRKAFERTKREMEVQLQMPQKTQKTKDVAAAAATPGSSHRKRLRFFPGDAIGS